MSIHDKEYIIAIHHELVDIANSMLIGGVHLIAGVRKLNQLRCKLSTEERQSPMFDIVSSTDDDTGQFPLEEDQELRSKFSPERLLETDAEIEDTVAFYKEDILKACRLIVEKYS